ncbi:transcriptional regulator [Arthrobacter sp. MYb227]|uniref:winged helix-turn-helix domain-containing protein n=1 Tax=Arthrobacter sp. MYb227 TaxID=1848601 RepID=UPI000CFBB5B5|nr:helix-turn-helix domain-containing protein [Arthrobacter sp. MYb227]PQZ96205.1 transcriptional regulator [Arthrobacter sp. MYb227]
MLDLSVIEDPRAAAATLDPIRRNFLTELREPASASMLATRLRIPRQKITYHLNQLVELGLLQVVEQRQKGIMTERLMQATAASYIISPETMGELSPQSGSLRNEFSAVWMVALAARTMREVGKMILGARAAKKPLATFALDTEIVFSSAKDRAEFSKELTQSVSALANKYHKPAENGRAHRLVMTLHPTLKEQL